MRDHNNEVVLHEYTKAELKFTYHHPALELTYHEPKGKPLPNVTFSHELTLTTNTPPRLIPYCEVAFQTATLSTHHWNRVTREQRWVTNSRKVDDKTPQVVTAHRKRDDRFKQDRRDEKDCVETNSAGKFVNFLNSFWANQKTKTILDHTLLEMIDLDDIEAMNKKGSSRAPPTSSSTSLIPFGQTEKQ